MRFSKKAPTLLVGAPGAGKTAIVSASFDYVEITLASTLTEEDIGGLPYREGDFDYRTIPALFRRLQEADHSGKSTALFLDELDKSRRSVADTLLTLIASRKVGAGLLPENTCIIAAANPPELGGGDGISDAMISRFCVVDYVPDPSQWAIWANRKYSTPIAHKIIRTVKNGEIPILDIAGEGLSRRITSPRTLDLALALIEEGNAPLIGGLLTASVSSHILHLVNNIEDEILDQSLSLARTANNRKTIAPLRLP
jgi:hypothetical protein